MSKVAVVITTINAPTRAVAEFAAQGSARGVDVVLVGDEKSPPEFHQQGARYPALHRLEQQFADIV